MASGFALLRLSTIETKNIKIHICRAIVCLFWIILIVKSRIKHDLVWLCCTGFAFAIWTLFEFRFGVFIIVMSANIATFLNLELFKVLFAFLLLFVSQLFQKRFAFPGTMNLGNTNTFWDCLLDFFWWSKPLNFSRDRVLGNLFETGFKQINLCLHGGLLLLKSLPETWT